MVRKILLSVAFCCMGISQAFGFWCNPCECCWTGAYVGGNLGGSYHTFSIFDIDYWWDGGTMELKNQNFLGGFQVGYNYQLCGVVCGLEASFDFLNGSSQETRRLEEFFPGSLQLKAKMDYFGTLHARVGFAADCFYLYLLGGAAYEKVSGSWLNSEPFRFPDPNWPNLGKNLWGWTFGGGVEAYITSRISLRAQVMSLRFSDFTRTSSNLDTKGKFYKLVINNDTLVGTVGINYKFW